MYCHAECSYQDICKALGITNIVSTYDFVAIEACLNAKNLLLF